MLSNLTSGCESTLKAFPERVFEQLVNSMAALRFCVIILSQITRPGKVMHGGVGRRGGGEEGGRVGGGEGGGGK
jgi:hypothetical protein